jgi:hypothetical protein
MAAVTTTTTTTTHTTRVGPTYTGPTIVTIHTRPVKRHVRHRQVKHTVHHAAAPNTRQLGGPPAPGTTVTTTVRRHTTRYD